MIDEWWMISLWHYWLLLLPLVYWLGYNYIAVVKVEVAGVYCLLVWFVFFYYSWQCLNLNFLACNDCSKTTVKTIKKNKNNRLCMQYCINISNIKYIIAFRFLRQLFWMNKTRKQSQYSPAFLWDSKAILQCQNNCCQ